MSRVDLLMKTAVLDEAEEVSKYQLALKIATFWFLVRSVDQSVGWSVGWYVGRLGWFVVNSVLSHFSLRNNLKN